jgi:hypothetical protein
VSVSEQSCGEGHAGSRRLAGGERQLPAAAGCCQPLWLTGPAAPTDKGSIHNHHVPPACLHLQLQSST